MKDDDDKPLLNMRHQAWNVYLNGKAFGLMAPHGWDYHDPELIQHAESILQSKGIEYQRIKETAPALFWYYDQQGELHLHSWE